MPATVSVQKTRPIINLGVPRMIGLRYDSDHGLINVPQTARGSQTNLALTTTEQTLYDKTLDTPIIASLKQASDGGTINMPTVASGSTATLATTDTIPSVSNMVTTDTTQNITGVKTFTTAPTFNDGMIINTGSQNTPLTINYNTNEDIIFVREYTDPEDPTSTRRSTIYLPDTLTGAQILVSELHPQTLENKTLEEPVIASLKQASTGGTINMPTAASGSTVTLATTTDIANIANMVDTNNAQTITGVKTLTSPVLTDGTHTISMPAAANLTANTTFATALDIASLQSTLTSLQSSVASATDFNTLKTILANLVNYLYNWIDCGSLEMKDIIEEVD